MAANKFPLAKEWETFCGAIKKRSGQAGLESDKANLAIA